MIDPLKERFANFLSDVKSIRRFFRTRRAILAGENIALLSESERQSTGYSEPWAFAIQKAIFAVIPATVIVWILDFLAEGLTKSGLVKSPGLENLFAALGSTAGSGQPPPGLSASEMWEGVWGLLLIAPPPGPRKDAVDQFLDAFVHRPTLEIFQQFGILIQVVATAYIMSFVVLRTGRRNRTNRKIALRAYLYFDGAYALVILTVIDVLLGFNAWAGLYPEAYAVLLLPSWAVIAVATQLCCVYWLYVGLYKVPHGIFATCGYASNAWRLPWQDSNDSAPWGRYIFAYLFLLPIIWLLWTVVCFAVAALVHLTLDFIQPIAVDATLLAYASS